MKIVTKADNAKYIAWNVNNVTDFTDFVGINSNGGFNH